MPRPLTIVCCIVFSSLLCRPSAAADSEIQFQLLAPESSHVPQTLLPLVHAGPVQSELGLTGAKLDEFLPELRAIDAVWWPSRLKPVPKRRQIVAQLEKRLITALREVRGDSAVKRLRQLEIQAEGFRALMRPEVAEFLDLSEAQKSQLAEAFAATDKAAATKSASDEKSAQAPQEARASESALVNRILTDRRKQKLLAALGEPLDTSQLARIYPLAPELIDTGHWTTDSPVTLAELRGRVVLLHFYAFQCHNCHANFPHYKRWHKTLKDEGVTVIGIQTPETSAEHDVAKVKQAAEKRGLEFPVLIDVDNENWDAWGNTMWPTVYVIDKKGYIRSWWQGELNWKGATGDESIEGLVDELLRES